jgi:hypothetical protein
VKVMSTNDGTPRKAKTTASTIAPALAIMVATVYMAVVPTAWATSYDYTFETGTTLPFSDGNSEELTGSFVADTQLSTITDAQITLTGPGPEAGTFTINAGFAAFQYELSIQSPTTSLVLFFAQDLNTETDALTGAIFGGTTTSQNSNSNTPTGGVTATREPGSLVILGLGLAALAIGRRRKRIGIGFA